MDSWEQFEEDCYLYLKSRYSTSNVQFVKFGSSDSTLPDIKVTLSNNKSFFIEAKESTAQCGQFVLIPDEESETFYYSRRNKSSLNEYSEAIIENMNRYFKSFSEAGTSGQQIHLSKRIFYNWIMNYYSSKGVRFFITWGSDFIIFPIEKFDKYFDVSATYRMKKSGSSDPSFANQKEVVEILSNSGLNFSCRNVGQALFISTLTNLNNRKITGVKYTYMFKESGKDIYKVRQLSNTCNSNVIFSIDLKQNQDEDDLLNFEYAIR